MAERPIAFSTEMVKAILEGRKSQTRRVVKNPGFSDRTWAAAVPHNGEEAILGGPCYLKVPYDEEKDTMGYRIWPRWDVGDLLWVRETMNRKRNDPSMGGDYITYASDFTPVLKPNPTQRGRILIRPTWQWQVDILPSIFMPRWASRITLEITRVRVERLQEISIDDAQVDTGIKFNPLRDFSPEDCVARFKALWDFLNAKKGYGWETNPWVWVLEFRRV